MGIKFFCPNGHKLNVKSFLAGKRGICPRCGIGVDIPTQSDPARLRSSKKKQEEEEDEPFLFTLPADLSVASPAGSTSGPLDSAEPEPLFPSGPAGPGAPDLAESPAEPTTLFAGISPEGGPGSKPAQPSPAKPAAPRAAAKAAPKPASPKPSVPAAKNPAAPAKPAAKPAAAAPPPPPAPAAAMADPLSEAPNAVWYLRPASGGQYGPAVAGMMRQWIAEGRVAGDSLVWREGWRDWRLASEVLGSLGIVQPAAPLPADAAPAGPAAASSISVGFEELGIPREEAAGQRRISSRKRFKHTQPLVIMILLLALVILLGVLIVVLANQPQSSSTNARLRPAESAEPVGSS